MNNPKIPKMKSKNIIRTKLALAQRLTISRNTLDAYLCRPGAPQRGADGWNVEEVAAFIAVNARAESTASKTSDSIGQAKLREISLRCERMAFKLECERGEWVKKIEVASAVNRIMGAARNALEQRLCNEYPSAVAGMDVPQCRIYGKRAFDGIMASMQKLADEFPE
jgi:hypothetical protein